MHEHTREWRGGHPSEEKTHDDAQPGIEAQQETHQTEVNVGSHKQLQREEG